MNKIYTARCGGYDDKALPELIESYFKSELDRLASAARILIKPNLLSASKPEKAVTTHPDFVSAVIKILKKFTDAELWLGDSPGGNYENYEKVLEVTGIKKAADENGVKIVCVENFGPVSKDGFFYSSLADEVDLIINLAKLKTHSLTGLTLSVKNLFGLIPGNVKIGYHREYPQEDELGDRIYRFTNLISFKCLNIIDGIIAHEGDGPSKGTPVQIGIAAASSDAVGLDIAVSRMVGYRDDFCLTTKAALQMGYDKSWIDVPETDIPLMKIPMSKKLILPVFIKRFLAEQIYVKPVVLNKPCIKCMLCYKSCPVDAISLKDGYPLIDRKKCIECYCCHEVCESDAVGLDRSWLHRLVVR